jgi:hypothetical protein
MYYIGCHWGYEDDGYICSSNRMRDAYRRRPLDFNRRIITKIYSSRQELLEIENKYLSLIKDEELGKKYYNITKYMNGHWTTDTDKRLSIGEKISKANKGKYGDKNNFYGKIHTNESKKKMSKSHKGHLAWNKGITMPEEYISPNKGKPMSEEQKFKISETKKGHVAHNKGKPMSEEQKEILRKVNTGKTHSKESKEKMSSSNKGRFVSDETKRKIGEANKARWAERNKNKAR